MELTLQQLHVQIQVAMLPFLAVRSVPKYYTLVRWLFEGCQQDAGVLALFFRLLQVRFYRCTRSPI